MTNYLGLLEYRGTSTVQDDGRLVNEYVHTYLFRPDAPQLLTPAEITAAIGIAIGSPYAGDLNAICYKAEVGPGPVMARPPYMCHTVVYNWSTAAPLPDAPDSTDPLDRRTLRSLRPAIQSRSIVKDRNGKLIVNTAGDPFDGGIGVDTRIATYVFRRNEPAAGFDPDELVSRSGSVNSTTWKGKEPGTVQVDIEAEEKHEGAYHYWAMTYTFTYDRDGIQPNPANAGFNFLGSGKKKRITRADEDPATDVDPTGFVEEPVPLDADGDVVPFDQRPDSCIFVEVDYFPEYDFNSFNL